MLPCPISSFLLLSFAILLAVSTYHCSSIKLDQEHPHHPSPRHKHTLSLLIPAVSLHGRLNERRLLDRHDAYSTKTRHLLDDDTEPTTLEEISSLSNQTESFSLHKYNYQQARLLPEVSLEMQIMIDLINEERRARSLPELCFNTKLNEAARGHSNDLRENGLFSHEGSDGSKFWERIDRVGYDWSTVAENIATDWSIERAHDGLMRSWSHRRNILKRDVQHIGIGITGYEKGEFSGNFLITQVFARPYSEEECVGGRSPTPAPGPIPTPGQDSVNLCQDSTLLFKLGKKFVSCELVRAQTWKHCPNPKVSSHCPNTCSSCSNCVDSGMKFKLNNQGARKNSKCHWVKKHPQSRCEITGIEGTCRDTCKLC